ncbi:MAG: peptidylprolyl isomerase [Desulfovibrio sp.]|nr:MAG: peptidylprolyl isomerase [Desulfovibrio sp.]
MRVLLLILVVVCVIVGFFGSALAQDETAGEPVVVLSTTQGDIKIRFFPDVAPAHVESFLAHAESGYFTGTTFHRVIPGFVIQGGDPNSKDDDPTNDGYGGHSSAGPGTYLPAEFNSIPHERGILSMARSQHPDSAGSQFFICVADVPSLDNQYTVFGQVVAGMDVADRIVNAPRDSRDRPLENQTVLNVTIEYWTPEQIDEALAVLQ